jgi:hypothetical protein
MRHVPAAQSKAVDCLAASMAEAAKQSSGRMSNIRCSRERQQSIKHLKISANLNGSVQLLLFIEYSDCGIFIVLRMFCKHIKIK